MKLSSVVVAALSVATTLSVGSGEFVPGRGIIGESCDLPTSSCPNDERISN